MVTAHGSEALITNDLGYAPFLNPWTEEYGMAIPLGSEHILTVVLRAKGVVVTAESGIWIPAVKYVDNAPDNHQGLNRAIAGIAQRFIFGPERKLIDKYLDTVEVAPQPLEPRQLGFLDAREARAYEFTWHRLITLLERNPDDDAAGDFDLDWELIGKGWCPPVYFPTNLPDYPVPLKRIGDSIEVDFQNPAIY